MWLRKTRLLPGSAPGGFEWTTPDDKVEVPDELGMDLVAIPGAGFEEVPVGEIPQADANAEVSEAPTSKRRAKPATKDSTIAPANLGTPVAE